MTTFAYKGYDASGHPQSGLIEAGTRQFRGQQPDQSPGEIGLVIDKQHARGVVHGTSS